jgi:hypothetical protein
MNNRYLVSKIEKFDIPEDELEDYALVRGAEILEHLPKGYTKCYPKESILNSLKRLFETVTEINGKPAAFNRKALCIGADIKWTPAYNNLQTLAETYPESIYKFSVNLKYFSEEPDKLAAGRGHPIVFYTKENGFD